MDAAELFAERAEATSEANIKLADADPEHDYAFCPLTQVNCMHRDCAFWYESAEAKDCLILLFMIAHLKDEWREYFAEALKDDSPGS